MFSLTKQLKAGQARSRGFTIVELLIVIVVIGILATLVIVTFSGIQQKGRNSQRQTDINALTSHIEAYYAENAKYPTLANMNDATWRSTNTKGLDPAALADPKNAATQTLVAAVPAAGTYSYAYEVLPANCDNGAAGDCTSFTLTAHMEGGGADYVKKSN
jgi:prepilin-type N-terminal cleavage/methylation domain-containing protein